jgi:cephalosporin hydroxylase
VLEIGALRGETTARMFELLGPDSELHVIDPVPRFDPAEHEAQFPGRYVFHRALSLDVLPTLPPVDVALIDGDHNWYTVFNELKLLAATAGAAGQELPVLVLHDVSWPYGHRDLYYEPSQIPEEFRHEHRKAGIVPGLIRLRDDGGLNMDLENAVVGGGPRNGVMCALQDFLAEVTEPVRHVHLPIYFGLSIVVTQARLAANEALSAVLDHLESATGRDRLLRLAERIRIDGVVHQHNWNRVLEGKIEHNRSRYLDLLKAALLDEHYLENEVRLEYLLSLPPGVAPDPVALRDPSRSMPLRFNRLVPRREAGRSTDAKRDLAHFPYTDMGRAALDHLEELVLALDDGVPGDLVDVGVGRGGGGVFLRGCLEAVMDAEREVWSVDPFRASAEPDEDVDLDSPLARFRADLNQVRDAYDRFELLDDRVRFVQGEFDQSLVDPPLGALAVLRVGESVGADLMLVLTRLLPRVSVGGTVVIEGVGHPIGERRLERVREKLGITDALHRVDWNTVSWSVSAPVSADQPAAPATTPHRVFLPAPRGAAVDPVDLTVVVVFFNMQREARRTLLSLSRSYQQGIDDLRYEVLVLDNGSPEGTALTAAEVESYGPEFRFIDMGANAMPSPTVALQRGIAESRGDVVAIMVDGAHVLTPGVLGLGVAGCSAYGTGVVAVQQWYVGPGQQGDAQQAGYDQEVEDRLFRNIAWPADGYRLFEIGHFIGDRDWFDGIVETNCLFAPRWLIERVGAIDDSFSMAGGGYENLDMWERLANHPGVTAVSLLGEGSFHQFHGGTTTNVADEAVRRRKISSYREHFRDLRGRDLVGVSKPIHYLGAMATKAARRTRSRRDIKMAFSPDRDTVTSTAAEPVPVPDEVKYAAIEAVWDGHAWREATWLGRPVNRFPTDLHSYQELLVTVRPGAVVLVGDDPGLAGRALHAASVLELAGIDGRVVAVGAMAAEVPDHPRITALPGDPLAADVVERVHREVDGAGAVVFLSLGAAERVLAGFDRYAPLVPVDGYVVVENTVVNGRPVESAFGPGPHEGVVSVLSRHPDWVPDVAYERYSITFNKNGFLRRMPPLD